MPDDPTHSLYDEELMRALGALVTEFSRLENAAKGLLARLISSHQQLGRIMVVNLTAWAVQNSIQTLTVQRLEDGEMSDAIQDWVKRVDAARIQRNRYIHGHWIAVERTLIEERLNKRGLLKTDFTEVQPSTIVDLAATAYHLSQEGRLLGSSLAHAGFAAVAYVDFDGATQTTTVVPPSDAFKIATDGVKIYRPNPNDQWPGAAYFRRAEPPGD